MYMWLYITGNAVIDIKSNSFEALAFQELS